MGSGRLLSFKTDPLLGSMLVDRRVGWDSCPPTTLELIPYENSWPCRVLFGGRSCVWTESKRQTHLSLWGAGMFGLGNSAEGMLQGDPWLRQEVAAALQGGACGHGQLTHSNRSDELMMKALSF